MRNEEQVLNEFKKLGYEIIKDGNFIFLLDNDYMIAIRTNNRNYGKYNRRGGALLIDMQEHQLLHELFIVWGWIK